MGRQAEKSETTRAALISAARELFAEHGYAAVGTTEIVTRANSSRGAMYHHFKDKQELFRAVYEQIQQELMDDVSAHMSHTGDGGPLAAFEAGLRSFLLACLQPDKARIGLIDAPAVLGWRQWRELDEQYALGMVTAGLQLGVDAGVLRTDVPVRFLAHLVLAALGEAGLLIAGATDPGAARLEAERALLALLDGLRTA
ncbi:DNA-binding transcriptional regulator, AcrR family [Amycolatopsis xylanica]|uniref:DNA-binding transcriptional regulator, AcrR family n=1 Tax=Amycolatopsis xylanica TaxID=589385 RepID=A0A1H3RVX5_9PSEU|nr:TetR/AcrR family transcriptional regulator [Amycolatopsis xylanica]SDZ29894.1 DNA-binding transcriptional regulator, AcrR family [Amycolatopsis xylanica]